MPTPRRTGILDIDGQSVYWEEHGVPDGVPALYLHGGPGGGLGSGGYVDRFDLARYRVIALEQRGCGRSFPLASTPGHDLSRNTTQQLIADIESLRAHLGVDAWVLNGVSWGSTLALAYTQEHPGRVLGVVLMAVTTTSAEEVHWISEGCQVIYPEAWGELADAVERLDPGFRRGESPIIDAVARLMRQPDAAVRAKAARAWGAWEDVHVTIGAGGYSPDPRWADPAFAVPFATLVSHYWSNHAFLDPPILERMERIAGIPGHLVHGRRDVSGPVQTAWLLHQRWPASTLTVIEEEGHGGPQMVAAWAKANDALLDTL